MSSENLKQLVQLRVDLARAAWPFEEGRQRRRVPAESLVGSHGQLMMIAAATVQPAAPCASAQTPWPWETGLISSTASVLRCPGQE